MNKKNERGYVLTVAIIFILLLSGIAAIVLSSSYNKNLLAGTVGIRRMTAFYHAKAGIVDAEWRIWNNYTQDLEMDTSNGSSGLNFTMAGYNPKPYHLDLDATPPTLITAVTIPVGYDVTVDISAVDKNNDGSAVSPLRGSRILEVTGKDV